MSFGYQVLGFGSISSIETDPNFASVVVLLHMNGTDGSTTFTDVIGKVWTAAADAQIDTAQSKFGGASGLFDGTGDQITTPDHADFNFGTGDVTIEFWIRFAAVTGSYEIFSQGDGTAGAHLFFEFDGSARGVFLQIRAGANPVAQVSQGASTGWSADTWYHVALVRDGDDWEIFRDGTSVATGNDTDAWGDYSTTFKIGTFTGYGDFPGHLDEFRITKGVARYTGAFTAPTAPFPDS
jgi:hypothetical protein